MPLGFKDLYQMVQNTMNGNGNGKNTLKYVNYDTLNNNQGFPHRLLLPKGTVGGQEYTLFVTINDLDVTNKNTVNYVNKNNLVSYVEGNYNDNSYNGNDQYNNGNPDSSDSSSSNDVDNNSNEQSSYYNNDNNNKYQNVMNYRNSNRYQSGNYKNYKNFNKFNKYESFNNYQQQDSDFYKNNVNGNWCKNGNGVYIYNCNNGNQNVGNGNGVLDNRSMGFPLDRNIIDAVATFGVENVFFKDVVVFHQDTSNKNQNYNKYNFNN
jgi:hypothetical protein